MRRACFGLVLVPILLAGTALPGPAAAADNTVVGVGAGAVTGALVAGPVGAVVGAVAGGVIGSNASSRPRRVRRVRATRYRRSAEGPAPRVVAQAAPAEAAPGRAAVPARETASSRPETTGSTRTGWRDPR